ncbi:Hypothetical protein A7982_01821 [Minicystis rosea]|nr:Hypothetical protein A7982_01821 [Minicystis rosea]
MLPLCFLTLSFGAYACIAKNPSNFTTSSGGGGEGGGTSSSATGDTTTGTGGTIIIDPNDGGITISDAQTEETPITPDAACAAVTEQAAVTVLPVDIIWMVDNSSSMAPAIQQIQNGLNAFTGIIGGSGIDYQVIMLSLRGATPTMISGSTRYPVCIPPPLSGDSACGDGTRFFQSSIDIRSTQPLEQFLGTLGQTTGFKAGDDRGGPPWAQHLRTNATKTIVVVTDDNARLSATDFETFAGGKNPFNSTQLPPGILAPMWNGLFNNYIFSGIYGWGNATDPSVVCSFADQTHPASSGPTYTTLVQKTNGVRAKICDGAAAWDPFFNAVAQAVIETAKLSCDLTIPPPSMGTLDPTKVNVVIGEGTQPVPAVSNEAACAGGEGWYYDNPQAPKKVFLCPASCDQAQASVGPGKSGHIDVLFGCQTILK